MQVILELPDPIGSVEETFPIAPNQGDFIRWDHVTYRVGVIVWWPDAMNGVWKPRIGLKEVPS